VLTFYQERYANEAWLRTATQRDSVLRLTELLGYRARPGVAAESWLTFTVDSGATVPIPARTRVMSMPAPAVSGSGAGGPTAPRTFETLIPIVADGRLNWVRVMSAPTSRPALDRNRSSAYLDPATGPAQAKALIRGQRVVIFTAGTNRIEEKIIASVATEDDRVLVTWNEPLQSGGWPAGTRVYRVARTHRLFAADAPATWIVPAPSKNVTGITWVKGTTDYTYPSPDDAAETSTRICLDRKVDGIAPGTNLLVANTSAAGSMTLAKVTSIEQVREQVIAKDSAGKVIDLSSTAATVTALNIDASLSGISDRTKVVVHELAGGPITFWDSGYDPIIAAPTVYVPGRLVDTEQGPALEVGRTIDQNAFVPGALLRPADIDVGRTVMIDDLNGNPSVALITAPPSIVPTTAATGSYCHLVLELQVSGWRRLDALSAFVLGNVALASDGETVHDEVLGDGNAAAPFQSFPLKKKPLTYVPSGNAPGVQSSLEVRVDGVLWPEVPSLYGQAGAARVYTTKTTDEGVTTVQFGDRVTGSSPTTGHANVMATYRVGSGLAGRVGGETLSLALDRPLGFKDVTNPLPATGGADPEPLARTRVVAPRTVRTFGRAVSLTDFEDLVTESGEVVKARAMFVWDGLDRAIFLTIAAQLGAKFLPADLDRLGHSLTQARDPNHRLTLANFVSIPITVAARVTVDPSYRRGDVATAVRNALTATLAFDAVSLAQPIHLSAIYQVMQLVAGVVAVDVTGLMFKRPSTMTNMQWAAFLAQRGVVLAAGGAPDPVQPHLRIFNARPDPRAPGAAIPAELATVESPAQDIQLDFTGGGA
jgi:hypothetical protein